CCSQSLLFSFEPPFSSVIYTLSLHDALPICPRFHLHETPRTRRTSHRRSRSRSWAGPTHRRSGLGPAIRRPRSWPSRAHTRRARSEEHTSELQSLRHLVCRLLLEKKKKTHEH